MAKGSRFRILKEFTGHKLRCWIFSGSNSIFRMNLQEVAVWYVISKNTENRTPFQYVEVRPVVSGCQSEGKDIWGAVFSHPQTIFFSCCKERSWHASHLLQNSFKAVPFFFLWRKWNTVCNAYIASWAVGGGGLCRTGRGKVGSEGSNSIIRKSNF